MNSNEFLRKFNIFDEFGSNILIACDELRFLLLPCASKHRLRVPFWMQKAMVTWFDDSKRVLGSGFYFFAVSLIGALLLLFRSIKCSGGRVSF